MEVSCSQREGGGAGGFASNKFCVFPKLARAVRRISSKFGCMDRQMECTTAGRQNETIMIINDSTLFTTEPVCFKAKQNKEL